MVDQESEESKVDLPEDEPATIKLLLQYMYEGEYEPKLPDGLSTKQNWREGHGDPAKRFTVVGTKMTPYHYRFPHTCIGTCPNQYQVCQHHECRQSTCREHCVDFVCKICCPHASAGVALPPADGDATQLLLHTQMYEIADKYDVSGLKEMAREKFLRACFEYWDDEHFAPAAHYAFSTTPEDDFGLREIISHIISQHMTLLNKPAIEALVANFNGLAFSLLKTRAKDLGWIKPDDDERK